MSNQNTVSLSLPDKVSTALGQTVLIKVGITDFSGRDREILIRLVGALSGPLPAVSQTLVAHLSTQVELPMMVPAGMPPGDHPILIEVLDRSNGAVLGHGEVFLEVQRTRSVAMHLSPPSIRRRLRGKVRVVLRNHDDKTHFIRMRTESDDNDSKVRLLQQEIEIRAGEMVRIKGRLRVRPFFVGKQKEHWYSIIGEGAGAPIYSRGNIRHIPMVGRNIKSVMGLLCVVLVWAGATLAIVRAVNPITKDSNASAAGPTDQGTASESDSASGGGLELPTLIDVSGKVTAIPDGSGVVVKWSEVSIGDVEGTGKASSSTRSINPNVANLSTTTDDKGSFSVTGLDASKFFEFTFSKAGHKTKKLIVQPNGEPVALEVTLEVGDGLISGVTVDETGKFIGGVNVTLTDGNITYQTTTPNDEEHLGQFSFANLSTPGTWVVDAQIDGRGLASTIVNLEAGGQNKDVSLLLSPNVTALEGTVTSAYFDENKFFTVTAAATDGVTTRTTSTLIDKDSIGESKLVGTFTLYDLPVGRTYTVTYSSEGYETVTEEIVLSTYNAPRVIDLKRSTGQVTGTVNVLSKNGQKIDPSRVAISIKNNANTYKSTNLVTNDGTNNGQYLFENIAPGTYIVTFEALGFEDQISEVIIGAGTTQTLNATLSELTDASKNNYLSFHLVKDYNETDSSEVTVQIFYRASDDCGIVEDALGATDSDCQYILKNIDKTNEAKILIDNLTAGSYYLVFTATGYSPKIVQATSKKYLTVEGKVTKEELTEVLLEPKGDLIGQVTDTTGSPIQGIQVSLSPAENNCVSTCTAVSNDNGEYSFLQVLDSKTYTIETTNDNYTPISRTVVGALGAKINVDLKMQSPSTVTGEVRYLNLETGNYEAVESKNFAVYYRVTPIVDTSTTSSPSSNNANKWNNAATLGISKALGSFRLGYKASSIAFDACVVMINEIGLSNLPDSVNGDDPKKTFLDSNSDSACDSALGNGSMPDGLLAKANTDLKLVSNETKVKSIYFSPSSGSLTGYVTVGGRNEEKDVKDVKVEARRIGKDGRVFETVTTSTDKDGFFNFPFLTPTSNETPPIYSETVPTNCTQSTNTCWSVRVTKTSVGSVDLNTFAIYPSKELNIPENNPLNIELGLGSVTISLSKDTGDAINGQAITLTRTSSSGDTTTIGPKITEAGKVTFSDIEIGNWNLVLDANEDFPKVDQNITIVQGVNSKENVVRRSLRGNLNIYLRGPNGPLVGAVVRLASDLDSTTSTSSTSSTSVVGNNDPSILCVTSETGICGIENFAAGLYTLVASATGLNSTTISASVIGGQTIAVSATLGSANGSLEVTLLDILGNRISGALITVTDESGAEHSCVTVDGVCPPPDLPFGIMKVQSEIDDYRPAYGTISVGAGGSAITLIATPINGKATFTFINTSGTPLYDVRAEYVSDTNEVSATLFCETKPELIPQVNSCTIIGLPQGLLTIRATALNDSASEYASVSTKISVTPGNDVGATFILPPKLASLAGYVDNASCPATCKIEGAVIVITDGGGKTESTISDSAGYYTFSNLAPGPWTVQTISTGFSRFNGPVNVPQSDFDIHLTALPGSLELNVRNPIGSGASDIKVTIERTGDTPYSQTTEGDGPVNFSGLISGTYSVDISDSQIPARYANQNFDVNIDRGSATRFSVYLGIRGSFIAVPIAGIPASAFGPSIPLEVDVALIKDNIVYHQTSTEIIGGQRVASFAGVTEGDYSIVIEDSGTVSAQEKTAIVAVTRDQERKTLTFTYSGSPILAENDYVDVSGFSDSHFNSDNAKVTSVATVTQGSQFTIARDTTDVPILSLPELETGLAFVSKTSDQDQWDLAAHTVFTNSFTYDVPVAPEVSVTELSQTFVLGLTNLIVKPGEVQITVKTGDATPVPIVNAKVTISDGYLLNSQSDQTDSNGLADFSDIPPGIYNATISAPNGFDSKQKVVVPDFGSNGVFTKQLSLGDSGSGNIEFSVGGDGTGSGLAGATVTDMTSGKSCVTAATTDSKGKCTIRDLSSGEHTFRITHDGYDMMEAVETIVSGRTVTTTVVLGSTTGSVQITAIDALSGLVLSEVSFDPSATGKDACLTNPCTFTGLQLTSTNFVASKVGYEDAFVAVDVTGGPVTRLSISMIPSNTNTLDITVYDSITGDEIQGVDITRDNLTVCNAQMPDHKTDSNGICTGLNQEAGQFTLKATKSGYEDTYAAASIISLRNTDVIISMRPTTTSFFLYVKDGSRSFAGVDGASIVMPTNSGICSAVSGTAGKYECINVPLRSLNIKVTKTPNYVDSYITVTPTLSEVAENGATVVLTSKLSTDDLTVTVLNSVDGLPIPGIKVNLCASSTNVDGLTDTDGECSLDSLPTGNYNVEAESPSEALQQYEKAYSNVTINPSGSSSVTITMRPIVSQIVIKVIDDNDVPISNANVVGSSGSCTTTGTDGLSTCSNMPRTAVTLTASKTSGYSNGYTTIYPWLASTSQNLGKIVLVKDPLPGSLTVTLINAETDLPITDSIKVDGLNLVQCVTTTGDCTFNNVALGQITVTASSATSDYETSYANVAISSLGATSATITMRPKAKSIIVKVLDTSGANLSGATVNYGSGWSESCAVTNPNTFTCSGLTSSSIALKVSKGTEYVPQYISAYPGTGPVSVVLSATPAAPSAPETLTVTVRDQNDNLVDSPTVKVDGTDCSVASSVCTKTGLAAGQYLVSASKAGEYGYATISMTSGSSTSVTIVVRSVSAAPIASDFTMSILNSSDGSITDASFTIEPSGSCTAAGSSYTCSGLSLKPTSFMIQSASGLYNKTYVNVTPTASSGGFAKVILSTIPAAVATINTLNVTVVDATTSGLLSGVAVTNCSAVTTASGNCTGTGLAVGPLSISATLTGYYEPAYTTVTISSSGPTSVTIAMRPVNATISFNIYDARTGVLLTGGVSIQSASPPESCAGSCSIAVSGNGNKSVVITAENYRNATATVAYLGSPVTLNFYLIPISSLTITFPAITIPTSTSPGAPTLVTASISGTSYSCTGASSSATTCVINDLPFGFYNITTNTGKSGSASVYSITASTTLS